MDENFVYVSFAAAFLIYVCSLIFHSSKPCQLTPFQLFRPQFLPLLDQKLQKELIISVSRLIAILGSADVALDGRHTPALYSRFLSSLMMKHALMMSDDSQRGELTKLYSLQAKDRQTTPSVGSKWPDNAQTESSSDFDYSNDIGYQSPRQEIEMDYSLSNFIKTVTQKWPSSTNMDIPEWWKSGYACSDQPLPVWSA
jgi:transcriptional regulatory protein LEU3